MRFYLNWLSVLGFVISDAAAEAIPVNLSLMSGAAVPITMDGVRTWASLRFGSSQSVFWQGEWCPPIVRCPNVDENGEFAVKVGSMEIGKVGVKAARRRVGYMEDVAGELGFSPDSELARGRVWSFQMRQSKTGLLIVKDGEWKPLAGSQRLELARNGERNYQLWQLKGRVEFEGYHVVADPPAGLGILFHVGAKNVLLPRRAWPHFRRSWMHLAKSGQLFGECSRRNESVELSVIVDGGRFQVPILWDGSSELDMDGLTYCSLAIEFGSDSVMVVGHSLLSKYDVSLHGGNGAIYLSERSGSEELKLEKSVSQPRLNFAESVTCSVDADKWTRCVVKPSKSPERAFFWLARQSGTTLTLIALRAGASVHGLNGLRTRSFGNPGVSMSRKSGSVVVGAREGSGRHSLMFNVEGNVVTLGFTEEAATVEGLRNRRKSTRV